MSERPEYLPNYSRPPVHEVVAGVQFDGLPLDLVDFGRLWDRLSSRYASHSAQLALDPIFETFAQRPSRRTIHPQIQILNRLELPRIWFVSKDDNEVLQFQRDRLVHNWRRRSDDIEYPHFEAVLRELRQDFDAVGGYFNEKVKDWSGFDINQCEVVYVNIIPPDGLNCSDIFRIWRSDCLLGDIEEGKVSISTIIKEKDSPRARLHVEIKPGSDEKGDFVWQLSLTFRGSPENSRWDSIESFLKSGREHIVQNFTQITTEKMHEIWGREK